MTLGEAIRQYRKIGSLTRKQLADDSSISAGKIGRIERSEQIPCLNDTIKIFKALSRWTYNRHGRFEVPKQ